MLLTRFEQLVSLSERQGHRCAYCGFPMWLPLLDTWERPPGARNDGRFLAFCLANPGLREIVPRHPSNVGTVWWPKAVAARQCTREHVHARFRHGRTEDRNLVAACAIDNHALKGHRTDEHALRIIQRLVRDGAHPHQVYQRDGTWSFSGLFGAGLRSRGRAPQLGR